MSRQGDTGYSATMPLGIVKMYILAGTPSVVAMGRRLFRMITTLFTALGIVQLEDIVVTLRGRDQAQRQFIVVRTRSQVRGASFRLGEG